MQSYLAGIIDGEGCIGIFYAKGTYQARVTVQMQNPEAVLLLAGHYPKGKVSYRNDMWTVVYSHNNAYELLDEIKEYLIVKHAQAKVVLSFLVHRRREHIKPVSNCDRCEYYSIILKKVREENKRVKTVDALISHEMRQYRAKPEEVKNDIHQMNVIMRNLSEGVETKDRQSLAVEPMSALEQEIVHGVSSTN